MPQVRKINVSVTCSTGENPLFLILCTQIERCVLILGGWNRGNVCPLLLTHLALFLPLVSVPDPKPTPARITFSIMCVILEAIYTPDEVWGRDYSASISVALIMQATEASVRVLEWRHASVALLIGLLIANIMADLFASAQPALLYLVPCTLIPLLGKAVLQVSSP